MPEPKTEVKTESKPTTVNLAGLKKLEADLALQKGTLKTMLIQEIGERITQLKDLGFAYKLVEGGEAKWQGKCSVCQQPGHTSRTCPQAKAPTSVATPAATSATPAPATAVPAAATSGTPAPAPAAPRPAAAPASSSQK